MKCLFAVFPTLNQAALVRRHLLNEGVYLEMCRTPECLLHTGCSFALKGDKERMQTLGSICERIALPFRGIFEAEEQAARKPVVDLGEEEQ